MTYPEGRQPIKWGDLTSKHSTWEAEAKALRRDYSLMQIDRNNLRSLLDATEAKVDELHDKLDDALTEAKALRARVQELEAATHGDFDAWYSGVDWHGETERGNPDFLSFLHDHKSACRKAFEAGRALQKQEGE